MEMKIADFVSEIRFVAQVDGKTDCLMNQDSNQDRSEGLWFNIDVPKGHGLKPGDKVRIVVERV